MVDADILCKICGKRGLVLAVRMRKGVPAYLGDFADILASRRIRGKRRMAHRDARADRADGEGVHTKKNRKTEYFIHADCADCTKSQPVDVETSYHGV